MTSILALGDNKTLQTLAHAIKPIQLFLFNPLIIQPLEWESQTIDWSTIDKVLIVSPNAVEYGLKKVIEQLPKQLEFFTIGESTSRLIPGQVSYPTVFNSEHLLALPALQQVQQQNIVIFKGQGGRTLLSKTLQQRQAIVYTIDCYVRTPLLIDLTEPIKIWQHHEVNRLIVTSKDSLEAFIQQLPTESQAWLKALTVIVTSERLANICHEKGFSKIKHAANFTAEDLLKLCEKCRVD